MNHIDRDSEQKGAIICFIGGHGESDFLRAETPNPHTQRFYMHGIKPRITIKRHDVPWGYLTKGKKYNGLEKREQKGYLTTASMTVLSLASENKPFLEFYRYKL